MKIIVVRGAGDLATGIIHRLYRSGFNIIALEIEKPMAVRRTVSFCEAVYEKEIEVEGVVAKLAKDIDDAYDIIGERKIPILIDPKGESIEKIKPFAVVDAIIAKKNLGTNKNMADITIAVGPGFVAGEDVDIVIESNRGHYLGKIIEEGTAIPNTGSPGEIMGITNDRVLRATKDGYIKNYFNIGESVKKGEIICSIEGENVFAKISGMLRGMIREGIYVTEGLKIGDIDPRDIKDHAYTISEKARAIGGGVLEGILYLENKKEDQNE